jgi:hypothetical protein
LPVLEELYFSFNDVHELSPLYAHDALQVIDLEGNLVDDFEEIKSLESLPSLRELTLNMNPVSQCESFSRQSVAQAIPQLEALDDIPLHGGLSHTSADLVLSSDTGSDFNGDNVADKLVVEDIPQDQLCTEFPVGVDDPSECRALQELRQRCQTPDVGLGRTMAESSGYSAAVAELRARRAELQSKDHCDDPEPRKDCKAEPSDQDLIVEALKRAPKPESSLWTRRSPKNSGLKGVGGALRGNGFSPGNRPCRKGAWSSSASSSTAYRPTTASSSTTRDDLSAAASELTVGEDGSSLAGNALAAIRRRRRSAASGAGAEAPDLDIRNLMRRYGESGVVEPQAEVAALGPRLATPDVRIGPRLASTAAERLAQFEKRRATLSTLSRPSTSASSSSLPGAGPLCEMTAGFSKSRPSSTAGCASLVKGGYALSGPSPTFANGDSEVLLLE